MTIEAGEKMKYAFALAALLAVAATSSAADEPAAAPPYKVTKTIPLGGADRWDYLAFDAPSHRLYISHGPEVTVVDAAKDAVIGTIGTFSGGTHGIGIAAHAGRGYTDDGKAGAAVSFDLQTLKTVSTIKTAPDADGIGFDPASGHIFVINGDSASVTMIDPEKDQAIATVDGGGGLEFGVADGKGKLYVNGADKQELVRIDTKTNQADAHWSIPTCKSPHGLAIDAETRRVFTSCVNGVMLAIDADNGKVIATLPIGQYTDAAAFDPVRKRVFSSNGDGTLSVYAEKDANTFVALPTVQTQRGARTMALDPASGRVYLATSDIDKIDPPATPGGRPHVSWVPGSFKLLILDPTN
jgi:DNA-binding beta-propeller fold protein YncE